MLTDSGKEQKGPKQSARSLHPGCFYMHSNQHLSVGLCGGVGVFTCGFEGKCRETNRK